MKSQRQAPTDLYITGELAKRPSCEADYLEEKRALQDLASRMADHPEEVLPRFVDLALKLIGGVAAGLSLFEAEPTPGIFRWRYLRGTLAPFEGATTPRNFSPCGVTLDQNGPVLSLHPERFYDWISDASIVVPEVLLVPIYIDSKEPLGTLWIVSAQEGHFHSGHARAASELASFVGIALRMLRSEQRLHAALEEQEKLTHEMSHRIKNLFAVAEGMVRISARTAQSKDEMSQTLVGRFHALAGANSLIRRSFSGGEANVRVADLSSLLQTIVQPYENEKNAKPRFSMNGPLVELGEQTITGMALVFHELATNAVKYGAARDEGGSIDIVWKTDADHLNVEWRESGVSPSVVIDRQLGFGSKLLHDTVTRQFGGKLHREWDDIGLKTTVAVPLKGLAD